MPMVTKMSLKPGDQPQPFFIRIVRSLIAALDEKFRKAIGGRPV